MHAFIHSARTFFACVNEHVYAQRLGWELDILDTFRRLTATDEHSWSRCIHAHIWTTQNSAFLITWRNCLNENSVSFILWKLPVKKRVHFHVTANAAIPFAYAFVAWTSPFLLPCTHQIAIYCFRPLQITGSSREKFWKQKKRSSKFDAQCLR